MNDTTPRARGIIIAAHAARLTDDELMTKIQDVIDLDPKLGLDDVDMTIIAAFDGDDDYDEMKHEVEHALDMCHDTDDDCAWNPIFDDEDGES